MFRRLTPILAAIFILVLQVTALLLVSGPSSRAALPSSAPAQQKQPAVPQEATPTPTRTGTPPTVTRTSTVQSTVTNTSTSTATGTPPTATPTPSSCGPTSNYTYVTGSGMIVPGDTDIHNNCDDCDTLVTLPFSYTLYGQSYTTVNVSSNGRLDFASLNDPGGFTNQCLPVAPTPNSYAYTIFAFWDDQNTTNTGYGVFTSVSGTAPNRIFNVEWRTQYYPATGNANYEARLYEGQSRFDLVYGSNTTNGSSATVGVQGPNGLFTSYECNLGGISTGLVLTFTQQACSTSTPAPATGTPTPTPTSTATPGECNVSFSDVPPGSTFYPYIHCLACLGIIGGYPDGTFKPNKNVTRGQLSKIVSNAAGFNDDQTAQMFQDVPVGSTFFEFIGRLASRGYISGYPCGQLLSEPCVAPDNLPYFRPGANSTRGQISKIVSNAAGLHDTPSGQQFQDVPEGSTYYDYIYRLVSRGVMSGYACGAPPAGQCIAPNNLPYFVPNNNATRGQTSKIVANTFFPNCGSLEADKP